MIFFLLLISKSASKTYTVDISSSDNQYFKISDEYNQTDITISKGYALMFVDWKDAVVELQWNENNKQYTTTFTKDIGLSFFTFTSNAEMHIDFISEVSFYAINMLNQRTDWRIHYTNLKSNRFQIETTKKGLAYHLYTVEPFGISNNPIDSDNLCGFWYHLGSTSNGKHGYFSVSPINENIGISDFTCPNGLELNLYSKESFSTTIPTIVDLPLSEIVSDKNFIYNRCFGGTGDDFKDEQMTGLPLYKYVFIQNTIKDKPEEYKLIASIGLQTGELRQEIKQGEIFSYAYRGYFSVMLSISSKNGNFNNFLSFSGQPIQKNEQNQPQVMSFDDSKIPDHIRVKDNGLPPGIIAAIVIAIVVVIAIVIVVVVLVLRKRKNSKNSSQEGNQENNEA